MNVALGRDHVEVALDALVALADDVTHGATPWEVHSDFNPSGRLASRRGYQTAISEAIATLENYRSD